MFHNSHLVMGIHVVASAQLKSVVVSEHDMQSVSLSVQLESGIASRKETLPLILAILYVKFNWMQFSVCFRKEWLLI